MYYIGIVIVFMSMNTYNISYLSSLIHYFRKVNSAVQRPVQSTITTEASERTLSNPAKITKYDGDQQDSIDKTASTTNLPELNCIPDLANVVPIIRQAIPSISSVLPPIKDSTSEGFF